MLWNFYYKNVTNRPKRNENCRQSKLLVIRTDAMSNKNGKVFNSICISSELKWNLSKSTMLMHFHNVNFWAKNSKKQNSIKFTDYLNFIYVHIPNEKYNNLMHRRLNICSINCILILRNLCCGRVSQKWMQTKVKKKGSRRTFFVLPKKLLRRFLIKKCWLYSLPKIFYWLESICSASLKLMYLW